MRRVYPGNFHKLVADASPLVLNMNVELFDFAIDLHHATSNDARWCIDRHLYLFGVVF